MKLRNNYYLRNKDTGYVISFTTRNEQMIFYNELKDWEVVDIVTNSNDGTTAEPLIKCEGIRKAVRAWAEVNGATGSTELRYYDDENCLKDLFRNEICFNQLLGLEDDKTYTVTELCGEAEE